MPDRSPDVRRPRPARPCRRFAIFAASLLLLQLLAIGTKHESSVHAQPSSASDEVQNDDGGDRVTEAVGDVAASPQTVAEDDSAEEEPEQDARDDANTLSPEERGRLLYRALRCDACHEPVAHTGPLRAPALDRLHGQLQRDWLVGWLLESPSSNAAATRDIHRRMPYLTLTPAEAHQLADYLLVPTAARETDPPAASEGDDATVEAGRLLYRSLGCLACHPEASHDASNDEAIEDGANRNADTRDEEHRDPALQHLFGGGDLARIAEKRPAGFFVRWLEDPAALNADHRMPVFTLTPEERTQLAAYLASRRSVSDPPSEERPTQQSEPDAGRLLFQRHRCQTCHRGPGEPPQEVANNGPRHRLRATTSWDHSCAATSPRADRPGYRLPATDVAALAAWVRLAAGLPDDSADSGANTEFSDAQSTANAHVQSNRANTASPGQRILEEHNCLACHARDVTSVLEQQVAHITTHDPTIASWADSLLPPTLKTVGAKLQDDALREAIVVGQPPRRPWLRVRMPRYAWRAGELDSLTDHLRAADRRGEFADGSAPFLTSSEYAASELQLAGSRLVTADGFGCVSCHPIGSVAPTRPEPGKQGPNLQTLGGRIRPEWFAAFVRNPARISPRMEMPSLQTGVGGVFHGKLDDQLAALWHVLNRPGFTPPRPDPVRILRQLDAANSTARPIVLHDVLQELSGAESPRTWIYPLLVGFPHRHNGLYDLESARLVRWTIGDMAYQRTEGKRWYWEPAGQPLLQTNDATPELSLISATQAWEPIRDGQFFTRLDEFRQLPSTPSSRATDSQPSGIGVRFHHRLHFRRPPATTNDDPSPRHALHVQQTWRVLDAPQGHGFQRELLIRHVPRDAHLRLQLFPEAQRSDAPWRVDDHQVATSLDGRTQLRWHGVSGGTASLAAAGVLTLIPDATGTTANAGEFSELRVVIDYRTRLETDRFEERLDNQKQPDASAASSQRGDASSSDRATAIPIDGVPGFRGQRLPLPVDEMPTALAWLPARQGVAPAANGTKPRLLVASLKGRVLVALDSDEDGLEETLQVYSDELATPYGLAVQGDAVDVLTKTGLLRLYDEDADLRVDRTQMVADGWGHTDDYHDWAVGLPIDRDGRYYVGLPCQQDERSAEAARMRGRILQLIPREPTEEEPRRYAVKEFAAGQRFPMGLALDGQDRLFATDNQGNYNAYNELNHIVRDGHYGFINRRERTATPATASPVTAPAIELPHPWTRSVNGICFLRSAGGTSSAATFGPWEGQLVGCEYDTRRLVRMSLHEVDGVLQGAVYPMSLEPAAGAAGFLGPLCAAIGPDHALYVGGIRDSGWGGANNVGEIVRLTFDPTSLPAGIAEIQAVPEGFQLRFSRPVDAARAADTAHYQISSAFRVSTPAYGGDDQGQREESVRRITVSDDRQTVVVEIESLEAGRVYAFRLQSLAADLEPFFPAEGFYTLRRIPRRP